MKRVLLEAALVLLVGLGCAWLANVVSPRGLVIRRNYFPGVKVSVPPPMVATGLVAIASNSAPTTNVALVSIKAQLEANGLALALSNQVIQLFQDPRYEMEQVIFVDARDDRHYQEGHIPAAYQFDHYRPAEYLAPVLAASQVAEQIVVYCNGGNCEDSLFAALNLREAGVALHKVLVYGGGMTEWASNGLPVETGARKSRQIKNAAP
jgi:rhodanese-related sulfurtransferase